MLKCYVIFTAILLVGEIHLFTARHIGNSWELETVKETSEEMLSVDLLMVQSGQEHFRISRSPLIVLPNCPCIILGRCSKKTTCESK